MDQIHILRLIQIILSITQVLDIIVAIILFFIYERNKNFIYVIFIWLGMILFFFTDYLLGPTAGTSHPIFSYSFTIITGLSISRLITSLYDLEDSFWKFRNFSVVMFFTSLVIKYALHGSFFAIAFPLSLATTFPVVVSCFKAIHQVRIQRNQKFSSIDFIFIIINIIWALHFLDYQFLRPLADLSLSIFGFSFALILTYITSIFYPVLINKRFAESLSLRLEDRITKKTQELSDTQAQLISREKLASVGRLTAGVAHEIKNPVYIIKDSSRLIFELLSDINDSLLRRKVTLNDEEENLLNEIQYLSNSLDENCNKIGNIIDSMLSLSREDSSHVDDVDLNKLLCETIEFCQKAYKIKYNFECLCELEEDVVETYLINKDSFRRVLVNIIDNALYAVYEKSKTSEEYNPTIRIRLKDEVSNISFVICDNGKGIPLGDINKIFEPFYSSKTSADGTGLGLSLAYDVVKSNGGKIDVKSKNGEGTVFLITLPKMKTKRSHGKK